MHSYGNFGRFALRSTVFKILTIEIFVNINTSILNKNHILRTAINTLRPIYEIYCAPQISTVFNQTQNFSRYFTLKHEILNITSDSTHQTSGHSPCEKNDRINVKQTKQTTPCFSGPQGTHSNIFFSLPSHIQANENIIHRPK